MQKELSCQHHYHLVESWCPEYIETQKRCKPKVVSKQYWYVFLPSSQSSILLTLYHRGDDICGMQSSGHNVQYVSVN